MWIIRPPRMAHALTPTAAISAILVLNLKEALLHFALLVIVHRASLHQNLLLDLLLTDVLFVLFANFL